MKMLLIEVEMTKGFLTKENIRNDYNTVQYREVRSQYSILTTNNNL